MRAGKYNSYKPAQAEADRKRRDNRTRINRDPKKCTRRDAWGGKGREKGGMRPVSRRIPSMVVREVS